MILSVISSVLLVVQTVPPMRHLGLPADGTDLGQKRILLDFDSPALVFRQVPMEPVNLVQGHNVKTLLDFFG